MTLRLKDEWVWDSWPFTDEEGTHHLFFLKASRSLGDPLLRHSHPRIGHAVSSDWRTWTVLEDALAPSTTPAWDDFTTWTGSVIRGPDRYHMFYTGTRRAEGMLVQRIGRADSDDLLSWERFTDEALVTADPRWYESVAGGNGEEQHWRDPWVQASPDGAGWDMLITARVPGSTRGRGVVGHAHSVDLEHWKVLPPRSEPGPFDQLEVVQTVILDQRDALVASCGTPELNPELHGIGATGGIYVIPGEGPLGPWDPRAARRVDHPSLYAARVINDNGIPALLGFRDTENGEFIGEIPDPVRLTLVRSHLGPADKVASEPHGS